MNEINQQFRKQKRGNALTGRLAHSHRVVAATQYETLRDSLNCYGGARHSRRYLDLVRPLVCALQIEGSVKLCFAHPLGVVISVLGCSNAGG